MYTVEVDGIDINGKPTKFKLEIAPLPILIKYLPHDKINEWEPLTQYLAKQNVALNLIRERNLDTTLIKMSNNYDTYCGLFATKMLMLQDDTLARGNNTKGIDENEFRLLKEMLG